MNTSGLLQSKGFTFTLQDTRSTHDSIFVCFVALRHKSIAMVMLGQSVHLTILFPGQA